MHAVFLFVAVLMLFSCYDPSEIHVHAYSLEWTHDAEIDLDEADILQGLFSVDENGCQIKFTKGNLYHEGSSAASGWGFEQNQYDYRTWTSADNELCAVISGQTAPTPDSSTGPFFWSKDASMSYCQQYNDEDASNVDDAFAFADTRAFGLPERRRDEIHDCVIPGCDCLTYDEWNYLCSSRADAFKKIGLAIITDVNGEEGVAGLVLLPDVWNDPYQDAFMPGSDGGFMTNPYSVEQWRQMEQGGAVFLPASGSRIDGNVSNAGVSGRYWSCSPSADDADCADYLHFFSGGSAVYYGNYRSWSESVLRKQISDDEDQERHRHCGYSVRLVVRIKKAD